MNVVALLAHPDDELMCAGTLARLVDDGHTVTLCTPFMDERRTEWGKAAEAIGCGRLPTWNDEDDFCWSRKWVMEFEPFVGQPDLLIAHRPEDHNTSHGHLGRIAETIARKNRTTLWQVDQVIPGGLCGTAPNLVVNITDTLDRKTAAVAAYGSQLDRYPGLAEAIDHRDRALGWQAGVEAAEGFTVAKAVWL